jgi:hypothetical protein
MLSNVAKWIYLAQDRRQQRALLISLMNIRVTQKDKSLSEKLQAQKQ